MTNQKGAEMFTTADFTPLEPLDPPRRCPKCRTHPGVYYLVSGAPTGCARFVPSPRDARRQREHANRINNLITDLHAHATTRGGRRLLADTRRALCAVEDIEPARLPALYASLANGRFDEVTDALLAYFATNTEAITAKWNRAAVTR